MKPGNLPLPPEHIYEPLKPSINAMEMFLLALASWSAINRILIDTEPESVYILLGPVWAMIWSIGLIGGSLLAFTGLVWRGKALVAIALQEVGYSLFAGLSIARAIAIYGVGEYDEVPVIALFAFAAICRVIQLESRVQRLEGTYNWINFLGRRRQK